MPEEDETKAAPRTKVKVPWIVIISRLLAVVLVFVVVVVCAELIALTVLGLVTDRGSWGVVFLLNALVFMLIGVGTYFGGTVTSRRRAYGLPSYSEADVREEDLRSQLEQGRSGLGLCCLIIGVFFFLLALAFL